MSEMAEKTAAAVLVFAGAVALIPFLFMWAGFAVSVLWGWFIVPTFKLAELTIPQAIGVTLVAAALRPTPYIKNGGTMAFVVAVLGPAWLLGAGWIVKHYFL